MLRVIYLNMYIKYIFFIYILMQDDIIVNDEIKLIANSLDIKSLYEINKVKNHGNLEKI